MATPASPPRAPEGESADRDPLLGNEYLLGSPDRRKGPHCLFTFLSIDAVIAAQLTPDQLPHSIYDTPPRRMVVSYHGIIEQVPPEPFLPLNYVANMKLDPRLKRFSIWGTPIFGEHRFPLPELPERRRKKEGEKRMQSGIKGLETDLSVTRDGKSEVGRGKGKGRVARRDGYGFEQYRELPSVAAHTAWCARKDARAERGDRGNGYEFNRYRELPSVVAHRAWCARTSTGEDGEDVENEDRGGGYRFEKYSELPSVVAHGAWRARTEDGDEKETEREDDE